MSKNLIRIKDNSPPLGNKRISENGSVFERNHVRTKRTEGYQKWGKRNNKRFKQL